MNVRRLFSVLSVSVLAGLASCDKDSKVFSDADLSTERSTVAGRVTGRSDSGLVGVVVTATAVDAKGAPLSDVPAQTALSGTDGRWSLELRPGLRWRFTWSSPDYKTSDEGVSLDLGLRESRNLDAERLRYRYGTVSGRTIPGASVAIEGQDVAATADANGDFLLERVAPGPVEIVGMVRGKGFWRTVDSVASESTTTITGRVQIASWKPLSSVSGTLVNQDGSPQAGAVLSTLGGMVRDTTDIQGRFSFDALPAGGRAVINVSRTTGASDRIVLSTPPEDSTWDLGELPVTGSVSNNGVSIADGLVVADSGSVVALPLLWKLLDTTRTVIGFVWDTTGTGSTARAVRTWGPRLSKVGVGGKDKTISVWVCVAAPLTSGGFDTLWSPEARVRVMVRRKAAALDTLPAPLFSHPATGTWDAPLRLGLSSEIDGAAIFWSTDSSATLSDWSLWSGDSIALHETATIWTFARQTRRKDSRIVSRTFDVRPIAQPAALPTTITANLTLARGSSHQASDCPDLAANVTFVLDSGATLRLPVGCDLTIDEGAVFEMRAGSTLLMPRGSYLNVGGSTTGKFVVKGREGRRASIRSLDSANPAGYANYYLVGLMENSGGSIIRGLDVDGSIANGIQIQGVEVDIVDSRIRNCPKGAAILFYGSGRPASSSGIRNDSTSNCRWSVDASPFALDRIATNPGFSDTLRVYDGNKIEGNNTWRKQALPLRFEASSNIEGQASLILDAGLQLRMGSSAYLYVTDGTLRSAGSALEPVRIEPANKTLRWGYTSSSSYGIGVASDATAEFRHTTIAGAKGYGIQALGNVSLHDCNLDSNTVAGIAFHGVNGHPATDTSFSRVSAKGNRWSVATSPLALGFLSSCPGLADSILVDDGSNIEGNATWHKQNAPIVVDDIDITVGSNASLSIEAGSTFVMGQKSYVYVGAGGGSLYAKGTSGSPIRFLPRTAGGWGWNVSNSNGYAIGFSSETTAAELSNVVVRGAQANGILFSSTLNGVGRLDSVAVFQTANPTSTTYPVLLDNASPTIRNLVGICEDGTANVCP